MTTLEIVLIAILWIFVGAFISHKRNWYEHLYSDEPALNICFNLLAAPIALIIALFKEFILDSWNNEK